VAEQKASPPDPFTAWRDWLGQAERQLNSFFNDMMGSEQYTRSMGQFNDLSLNMQKSMSETMSRYLSSLNLPTKDDFAALGQRLAAIEDRLAIIENKPGDVAEPVAPSHVPVIGTPRPPRTKKPAKAKG
jgi:polyhydroxyalkanoic acid synthase PhaR subunit